MTAAHCLDGWGGSELGLYYIKPGVCGVTVRATEYVAMKYFYVGSHHKLKTVTNNGDVGLRMERDFVEGIHAYNDRNSNNRGPWEKSKIIKFHATNGLYPEYHTKQRSHKKVLDIALVTLTEEMRFNDFIQPVKIGPISDGCRWCQGDCDDSIVLHAYGWGEKYQGKNMIF